MTKKEVGITVVENKDGIDAAIARVREIQVQIANATKKAEEKKAKIEADLKEETDPLKEELSGIAVGVYGYTIGKEQELVDSPPDGKTATFPNGLLLWRTSPGAIVMVGDNKEEDVIAEIKTLGLEDLFIRVVEKPNKDAMLNSDNAEALEDLQTVRIAKPEIFTIKPNGSDACETKVGTLAKIWDKFRKNRIKK
ncbi:MAG: host-nuclease inhibitor Gam family protein [bacterium]|nr:host-nuclease inhibitor Gam family protein [bacterium]